MHNFSNLEEALVFFSDFTLAEILFAKCSSQYLGVFEQLRSTFEFARVQNAMQAVAKGCGFFVAKPSDLEAVDLSKFPNSEHQRLIAKLKALPLGVSTIEGQKYLLLATSDPFCLHTQTSFSKLFNCPVKPVIAWETEIQKKLMYGSGTFPTLNDSSSSMPILDSKKLLKADDFQKIYENLLNEAFKFGATSLEIEFQKQAIVILLNANNTKKSLQIETNPENFIASLLEDSRLVQISAEGFSAWARYRVFKQTLSYEINFFKSYLSSNTRKNNILVLSNFTTDSKSEFDRFYLPISNLISTSTGLVLLDPAVDLSLLKKAYPGAYFPSEEDLLSKPAYFSLAQYCLIFLVGTKDKLPLLPSQLLMQVVGILNFKQLKQNCGFCAQLNDNSQYDSCSCQLCQRKAFSAKLNITWLEIPKINGARTEKITKELAEEYKTYETVTSALISKGVLAIRESKNSPLNESPLFAKPVKLEKKGGFHSVVLKMDDSMKSLRESNLDKAPAINEEKPKSTSYHSVILDLGDDLKSMREKLKKETEK